MLVVSTAALGGLTVLTAPVASAAPAPAAVTAARPHCKPAHFGRDFRWDDRRRGASWDRVIGDTGRVVDVKHLWRGTSAPRGTTVTGTTTGTADSLPGITCAHVMPALTGQVSIPSCSVDQNLVYLDRG